MPACANITLLACLDKRCLEDGTLACTRCEQPFYLKEYHENGGAGDCLLASEQQFLRIVYWIVMLLLVIIFVSCALECGGKVYKKVKKTREDEPENLQNLLHSALLEDLKKEETRTREVIKVGAKQYRVSMLGNWSKPMRRYLNYGWLVDVIFQDIIGVGLSLFYNFHTLPMFAALLAQVISGCASHFSGYEKAIVSAKMSDFDAQSLQDVRTTSLDFAMRLRTGLAVMYVIMLLHAWFFAFQSCKIRDMFNLMTSTMRDFAVQLDGLPRHRTSEKDLLNEMQRIFKDTDVKPFGVSIGFDLASKEVADLAQQKGINVWDMLERLVVKFDTKFQMPTDGRFGEYNYMFGYPEALADADDVSKFTDEVERDNLTQLLHVLKCSGKAWVVFKSKVDVERVLHVFRGFWIEDKLKFKAADKEKWITALQPEGLTEVEDEHMSFVWPGGSGIVSSDTEIDDQFLHKGTVILDPTDPTKNPLVNAVKGFMSPRKGETPKEAAGRWGNHFEDIKDGTEITVKRRVKVSRCLCEPPSVMWYNLGTRNNVIAQRTVTAVLYTGLVFLAILLLVYAPYAVRILQPYQNVNGNPSNATSQIMGFFFGIANNILSAVMGIQAWGIGFSSKWALDVWVLVFNFLVATFNTCFNLFFTFQRDVGALLQLHVNLADASSHTTENLRLAVDKEIEASQTLYNLMVPGWLFSGLIIGNLVGFIVPWVQNYLLLQIVFVLKCLPTKLEQVLTLLIPYNPDPTKPLSARRAEYIFQPGEISLAWDYGDKIITPSICFATFFFLSPQMWRLFNVLIGWVNFMYLFHRYYRLQTCKKQLHDSEMPGICGLMLWFLPLSLVASAWMYWTVRLGIQKNLVLVPVAFVASAIVYWMGLAIILPLAESGHAAEKDRDFDKVDACVLYNWFNCNPIHVLKSNYAHYGSEPPHPTKIPFFFGKEYLLVSAIPHEQEEALSEYDEAVQQKKPDLWKTITAEGKAITAGGRLPKITRLALAIKRELLRFLSCGAVLIICLQIAFFFAFANDDISNLLSNPKGQ